MHLSDVGGHGRVLDMSDFMPTTQETLDYLRAPCSPTSVDAWNIVDGHPTHIVRTHEKPFLMRGASYEGRLHKHETRMEYIRALKTRDFLEWRDGGVWDDYDEDEILVIDDSSDNYIVEVKFNKEMGWFAHLLKDECEYRAAQQATLKLFFETEYEASMAAYCFIYGDI